MPVIRTRFCSAISTLPTSSDSTVAVVEPHDVVELGRGDFEHVALFERFHAVAETRRDVHAVSRLEHASVLRAVLRRALETQPTGEHADRFVLDAVVLKAQRFALAQMQDLSDVTVGMRPDELVAPRLVDANRFRRIHRNRSPYQRS